MKKLVVPLFAFLLLSAIVSCTKDVENTESAVSVDISSEMDDDMDTEEMPDELESDVDVDFAQGAPKNSPVSPTDDDGDGIDDIDTPDDEEPDDLH